MVHVLQLSLPVVILTNLLFSHNLVHICIILLKNKLGPSIYTFRELQPDNELKFFFFALQHN